MLNPSNASVHWQKELGNEKVEFLFPALYQIYRRIKDRKEEWLNVNMVEGYKLSMYEPYDGNMYYLLTHHSLWNRKHRPFLLCNCKNSEGVTISEHEGSLIPHGETLRLCDGSLMDEEVGENEE